MKSEALQAAASESERFRALCAEILPNITMFALFSCPVCSFKRGSARDLVAFCAAGSVLQLKPQIMSQKAQINPVTRRFLAFS